MQHKILQHRVIDGDSIKAILYLGFGLQYDTVIRLHGVDAPKLSNPRGKQAKEKLTEYMQADKLVCEAVDDLEVFGRVLGRVFADGVDLNQRLIDEGYAEIYQRKEST